MPEAISPQLIYDLTTVSAPSLSPDGTRLAYVQSRVDKKAMETISQLMMMGLPDGKAYPFTAGDSDTGPRFSPDGKTLAFLRPDSESRQQIWLIPTTGGEASQLTHVKGGITELSWSPDSSQIAFVSDVDPDQGDSDPDASDIPSVKVVRRVRYRADTIGWRGDAFRHIFIADVKSGATRQLTDGEGENSTPVWSPDGMKIAFISDRGEDRDFVDKTAIFVVEASGGNPEVVSQGLTSVSAHAWSPDGSKLAVVGSDNLEVGAGWQGRLFILEQGNPPLQIGDDTFKPETGYVPYTWPPDMRWTDHDNILFLGTAKGETFICEIPSTGGQVRKIAGGNAMLSTAAFDSNAKNAVVTEIPPTSAGDLVLVDMKSGSTKQLTSVNQNYFNQHPPAKFEKFTLSRKDFDVESRLFLPSDFDPSRKYPLVLDIHGGPHGAFYDSFNPIQQILASSGYIVLAVNPRGSATYGISFMKAVLGDWGGEDYLDIMAAVDEVSSRPYVDETRMGVTGYSYGGYMSSWIIGHTNRFKAAAVSAPVTDLSTFYGTSDIGISFGEIQMKGPLEGRLEKYLHHSPLTYASNVETPVLLMHGEDDARCPIDQSEQYFVALKRLGKTVEFVRYPGCAHSLLRSGHPKLREEYLTRVLAWFDKYIG